MKKNRNKKPAVYFSTPNPKDMERYFAERKATFDNNEQILEEKEEQLRISKNLLDDTLHEIRKINNQIKANTLKLSKNIELLHIKDTDIGRYIFNTLKTLDGNTSLLSIRMDAYDLTFNPTTGDNEMEAEIGVYNKVEKVYKCLYPSKKEKSLVITLSGKTERKYRLRNSIELAFFILIENAIKYSPFGSEISISFEESGPRLNVLFENYAVCPLSEEMPRLTERGFRSAKAKGLREVKGSGLGLFLLKKICEINNVAYDFQVKNKTKSFGGKLYNTFCVLLTFGPHE